MKMPTKMLFLVAVVHGLTLVAAKGMAGLESYCNQCGGKCNQACGSEETELAQGTLRYCKNNGNVCCIPIADLSCYNADGACLKQGECTSSGGEEIPGSHGFCPTIGRKDKTKICCANAFSVNCLTRTPPGPGAGHCAAISGQCIDPDTCPCYFGRLRPGYECDAANPTYICCQPRGVTTHTNWDPCFREEPQPEE